MKVSRSEFADGFELLGSIGLLVAVFVIPSQWAFGAIRPEALAGAMLSVSCVFAAVLIRFSLDPVIITALRLLLVGGVGYLALVPFVAAEIGYSHWLRIGAIALALAAAAFIGGLGLRRRRQSGAQLSVQCDDR